MLFSDVTKKEWDEGREWLYKQNYTQAANLYLSECYSSVEDAADGVKFFCNLVAKTKAMQYLLMGYNSSK